MTKFCDQRDELDPVRQLISSVRPLRKKVPEFPWEEYKKKILAEHRERIRDGRDGFNGPYTSKGVKSKGVKLSPVEEVDQLIKYKEEVFPLIFAKMVQAQEEAVDKLINEQGMPDASYENFCSSYKALSISS